MRRLSLLVSAACAAAASVASLPLPVAAASPPPYVLIDLQQFGVSSSGFGINDAGQVTGSLQVDASTTDVFRYSTGVTTALGTLGGPSAIGTSINLTGEVAGWSNFDSSLVSHAFLWNGSAFVDLKTLAEGTPAASTANSYAFGLNDAAAVVGESEFNGTGTRAFLFNGTTHQLPLPGQYSFSGGMSINKQGQILVKAESPTNDAWIYSGYAADGTGGTYTQIPPLGAGGQVFGAQISNSGIVVGQATPPGDPFSQHAIRYAGGVTQDLGLVSPWIYSDASAINDAGLIVGCIYNDTDERGALYDGSWHDLNDLIAPGSGMVLGCAYGINNAGQITGEGLVNGQFHAYMLTPSTATPTGTDVVVSPTDTSTGTSPVSMTFSDVTGAGTTTLAIGSTGPPVPSGFTLGGGIYYDLSTTATYSGSITVCISYTGLTSPALWHYTGGTWVQVTPVSDNGTTICGSVSSLSPFALLMPAGGEPPAVAAGGPYSVNEGGSIALTADGFDPNNESLTYTWDLDGNGTFETPGKSVLFSAGALDGPTSLTVAVRATNTDGLFATDTTAINVANVAPTVGSLVLPAAPALLGATFVASGSFTDPAPADTHVAVWDWGDGTASPGSVTEASGTGTVTGSHAYFVTGSFTLRLTVTDDDGGSGSAQATFSVIYNVCPLFDPNKGSTGGVAPIKIALCDANGVDVSRADLSVTAVSTTAPGGLTSVGSANRGGRFRFDATLGTSGGYIYNLDTSRDPAGSYVITFRVGSEGYLYSVRFTLG